jgi:hypothetical protein
VKFKLHNGIDRKLGSLIATKIWRVRQDAIGERNDRYSQGIAV